MLFSFSNKVIIPRVGSVANPLLIIYVVKIVMNVMVFVRTLHVTNLEWVTQCIG